MKNYETQFVKMRSHFQHSQFLYLFKCSDVSLTISIHVAMLKNIKLVVSVVFISFLY